MLRFLVIYFYNVEFGLVKVKVSGATAADPFDVVLNINVYAIRRRKKLSECMLSNLSHKKKIQG